MTTTIFEDKLSDYLAIAEKVSHGYYIANGVYHQNLEPLKLDEFIESVKTIPMMFEVAFANQINLQNGTNELIATEAFWNHLKRQKTRFENISKNQLKLSSNANNVKEIITEFKSNNAQVIAQLQKAKDYNLLDLPIVFFTITGDNKNTVAFKELRNKLINTNTFDLEISQLLNTDALNLEMEIADETKILSWFIPKEDILIAKKQKLKEDLEDNKKQIEQEKQAASNAANKEVEEAAAMAKKAQEDALKLMEEMQKKYGLN